MSDKKTSGSLKSFYGRIASIQALHAISFAEQPDLLALDDKLLNSYAKEVFFLKDLEKDEVETKTGDKRLIKEIVGGVIKNQEKIDENLMKYTEFRKLEPLMIWILRAGTYELLFRKKTPPAVAVSEYVKAADSFFGEKQAAFVNAVLDKVKKSA
jgi:N utilization substance protein B